VVHNLAMVDAIGECINACIEECVLDTVVKVTTTMGGKQHLVLMEFSRGLVEGVPNHNLKVATTRQVSLSVMSHFQRLQGPGVEVLQQMSIVSCHGKADMASCQTHWQSWLEWCGIKGQALKSTLVGCMTACIEGNHEIANMRRRLMVDR
jgi:hypothetical protein